MRILKIAIFSSLLLLITACSAQKTSQTAEGGEKGYAGIQSSPESAYTVGSKVLNTLVANWSEDKTTPPYTIESSVSLSGAKTTVPTFALQTEIKAQMPRLSTAQLIDALQLEGHVEGGYFRQTFKADHRPPISTENGERVTLTSIYYLLTAQSPIGHFHMNQSDIVHYFHMGDPITYYLIHPDGTLETVVMGSKPNQGQVMQMVVNGGTWKASRISTTGIYGYGLIGEAVSPGFDYNDMQLGQKANLLTLFPQHTDLIMTLAR